MDNKKVLCGIGFVASAAVAYVLGRASLSVWLPDKAHGNQLDNQNTFAGRGRADTDVTRYFSEYLRTHQHQARELERVIDSLSQLGARVQRQERAFASIAQDDQLRETEHLRIKNKNKYQYDAHMKADKPVIDRFLDSLTETIRNDKPGDTDFAKKLLLYANDYIWVKCDAKINDIAKKDVIEVEPLSAR